MAKNEFFIGIIMADGIIKVPKGGSNKDDPGKDELGSDSRFSTAQEYKI